MADGVQSYLLLSSWGRSAHSNAASIMARYDSPLTGALLSLQLDMGHRSVGGAFCDANVAEVVQSQFFTLSYLRSCHFLSVRRRCLASPLSDHLLHRRSQVECRCMISSSNRLWEGFLESLHRRQGA